MAEEGKARAPQSRWHWHGNHPAPIQFDARRRPPESVNHGRNSGICYPHQRQALFDRPQARQCKVLVRPGTASESAIICQIDKHVGARARACAIGKNGFISNQWVQAPAIGQGN